MLDIHCSSTTALYLRKRRRQATYTSLRSRTHVEKRQRQTHRAVVALSQRRHQRAHARPEQARRRAAGRLVTRAAPAHERSLRRSRRGSVSLGARIPRVGERLRAAWCRQSRSVVAGGLITRGAGRRSARGAPTQPLEKARYSAPRRENSTRCGMMGSHWETIENPPFTKPCESERM